MLCGAVLRRYDATVSMGARLAADVSRDSWVEEAYESVNRTSLTYQIIQYIKS
jgi:hypothetical protein